MTKTCSCGAHFQLHVELAVHRQKTGHAAFQLPEVRVVAPVTPKTSRSWRKTVLAGATVLSLVGLTAGVSATIRSYTSWTQTANVLLFP
ncbi:MAG: hypothetical protein KF760_22810 [Candidatus Eremiobacteraeota bacterium]|nr:hypothetical protein [Candidatus Eremiobacteraeota bacterium]MCW5869711.1 hypothetical protein [Candidatus Eremiobacteraeota bacterium]